MDMHIAFGADDHYTQHLGVTLASLLLNLGPEVNPHIYILTDGISLENRDKIDSLKNIRDFQLEYLEVRLSDFDAFPAAQNHLSTATYFRLQLPYRLPHLDKILYLDTDLVIDRDITPLWQTSLSDDDWVGAVFDPGIKPSYIESIGMHPDDLYFNAGILLMNLTALRRNDFMAKCHARVLLYGHAMHFSDQDILNPVCKNHVFWLDPQFNLVHKYLNRSRKTRDRRGPYTEAIITQAISSPVIIHYTGGSKPWLYACRHNLAWQYRAYLKQTPWCNYRYPDKNFKNFLSKNLYFFRQWVKGIFQK